MFEFSRELKRIFAGAGAAPFADPVDGLTAGDASLLELLDLSMLHAEARAADVAAGRISAKNPAMRAVEASVAWRELARRTGDAAALRKAASHAEGALKGFEARRHAAGAARARREQAACALLGAELFGDEGLNAAAEQVLGRDRGHGPAAAAAEALLAGIEGRRALSDVPTALAAAVARFEGPLAGLDAAARRDPCARLMAAEQRMVCADLLIGGALRHQHPGFAKQALALLDQAERTLDAAYEPLTSARIALARGSALTTMGELSGDAALLSEAVDVLVQAGKDFGPEQSPLDWARGQVLLADALQALGEATTAEPLFEQAVTALDRALVLLKNHPGLPLRTVAANSRALCLARCAELSGDLTVLDVAEAALKMELIAAAPGKDPVAWAVMQTNLARLYEARVEITGRDDGRRAAAAVALNAAFDVFAEHGLRSLADLASQGLARLARSMNDHLGVKS